MVLVVFGWSFAAFLYFKIAFDAFSYHDISITAAFLLGIIFGGYVFFASGVLAMRLLPFNWTPGARKASVGELVKLTLLNLLSLWLPFTTLAWLVIFGFSKKLSSDITVFNYSGSINDDFVVFLIVVAFPIFLHYAMIIFLLGKMQGRARDY